MNVLALMKSSVLNSNMTIVFFEILSKIPNLGILVPNFKFFWVCMKFLTIFDKFDIADFKLISNVKIVFLKLLSNTPR